MQRDLRILLIEDRAIDAELCVHELNRAGLQFECQRVRNREGLLHALESFAPDVILADFTIPSDIDGFVALDIVRVKAPGVPFIYVSGTIGEERAAQALERGAADYVPKDRLHELGAVVKRALEAVGG
jgi:CheY-like chemotaxis protein